MARQILIFDSIDEAKSKLNAFSKNFTYPSNNYKKEELLKYTVQSSVYRALPSGINKPSVIYRDWFSKQFEKYIFDLQKITNPEDYLKFVLHYANSLIHHWNAKIVSNNDRIGYGPASKIINLIGKMVNESKYFDTSNVIEFLHVPFDEYSLKPLKNIINELTEVSYKMTIPRNPSMKYIINKEHYKVIQKAVFNLCELSGILPIVYDYWSWNDTH